MDASGDSGSDDSAAPSAALAPPQWGGADAGLSAPAWLNNTAPAGAVRRRARRAARLGRRVACSRWVLTAPRWAAAPPPAACRRTAAQADHEEEDEIGLGTRRARAVAVRSVPGAAAMPPPPPPAAAAPPPAPIAAEPPGGVWAVCQARAAARRVGPAHRWGAWHAQCAPGEPRWGSCTRSHAVTRGAPRLPRAGAGLH
jgi:hypothetical protein